ncbi:unnamed protein product [Echinostoma caproni]|uniref:P53 domain-containing protein n=1 Tax=Echinostoma caproni TaxID=27848 RepID=A0A183AQ53_9TREM|nr:unnamed protein product [Echinostoma caproni]
MELFTQQRTDNSEKDLSQDQGSQSVLLPAVRKTILCSIHCYNSCLGIGLKGEVDLLITLESCRSDDPFSAVYDILGLQKLRVRCCASPSRDAKDVLQSRLGPPEPVGATTTAAVGREQNTGRLPVRKASRCLSLTISSKRNIRAVRTRRSDEAQEPMNTSVDLPPAEVVIRGRKYFLLLVAKLIYFLYNFPGQDEAGDWANPTL